MNKTLFAQDLPTTPHLFSGGLSKMVIEHFSRCFIPKDPSLGFLKLLHVVDVAHGDIFRSMALVLGANILLAMVKDIGGFHLITIGKVVSSTY
jgi:hypothetical protein